MGFFKNILYRLGQLSPPPRRNAFEFSSFGKLPPELILYITHFLPPESAASFSICCRPIYFALGTQHLEDLQEHSNIYAVEHRDQFLTLLERDLPNNTVCYYCIKLHSIKKAHRHVHWKRDYASQLPCWKADYDAFTSLYIHGKFSSTIFEMTMKLHRQGLDYSDLLRLMSQRTKTDFQPGYVEQQTAVARIVNGNLLIREQKRFMIPTTQPIPFPWNPCFFICTHIKFLSINDLNRYLRSIRVPHWKTQKVYSHLERLIRCKYCCSEYRVDFKQFGECGNAMYVTKWLDLGEGPLDHRCQSHFSRCGEWQQVEFELGSICSAFEGKEHFDFDSDSVISPKARKELFKKTPQSWPEDLLSLTFPN